MGAGIGNSFIELLAPASTGRAEIKAATGRAEINAAGTAGDAPVVKLMAAVEV